MPPAVDAAVLAPLDVPSRVARLAAALEEAGCDALIVTKLENIRYLTGFSGSAAVLLVSAPDKLLLTTDGRYRDQAAAQIADAGVVAELVIGSASVQLDAVKLGCASCERVGLEAANVTWAQMQRFATALERDLIATTGVVERLRIVKDAGEQARIEAACAIADAALTLVKDRLTEGPTETEFAAELEYAMRRGGGEGPAFETIVASGPNSAMPHARPSERVITSGDLVVVDFGAIVDGYRSDMTRTFSIGEPQRPRPSASRRSSPGHPAPMSMELLASRSSQPVTATSFCTPLGMASGSTSTKRLRWLLEPLVSSLSAPS
jgi:Xaa-Pro aminopeptidase